MGNRHKLPQTSSAMENRSHSHGFKKEILCTGSIPGSGCTWILQTQHRLFRFKIEVKPTLSESDHRLLVQYRGIHGFSSEPDTDFLDHRDARRFSAELRLVVLLKACTRSGSPIEWEKEPPHGPPWPFYSHAPGSTLVALETTCIPPARITFLGQELRIKI
jgi:hypothetical protein